MKSFVVCSAVLALAACSSSSSSSSTTGTTGGSGSSTGARSTGTGTSSGGRTSTGTAAGTSTGNPLGMACDVSSGTDPCNDYLLDCSADTSTTTTTGVCELPAQFEDCAGDGGVPSGAFGDAGYGCQDGGNALLAGSPQLNCSAGFVDSNQDPVNVCTFPCSTGADCLLISEGCVPSLPTGCFPNDCEPTTQGGPLPNQGDTCGGNLFGSDAGDGQCLGFVDSTNNQTALICYQEGHGAEGTPCNPFLRSGKDPNCAYGLSCVPNAGQDGGLCYPLTLDGGCAEDEIALEGTPNPDLGTTFQAGWGICAGNCTTSQTCVADGGPDAGLLGFGTCQLLSDGQTSACLP